MGNDQSVKLEHFHYTGKSAYDVYGSWDGCRCVGSVSFDPTVSVIGDRAFCWCENLQSIEIPATITRINDFAFEYCRKLKSVMIPDTITHIGKDVFFNCKSLEEVTLPPSITTMGTKVFSHCDNLKRVNILSKITGIPDSTFYGCIRLQSVTMSNTITSIATYAFEYYRNHDSETRQRIKDINAGRPHQSGISKALTCPKEKLQEILSVTKLHRYEFAYCSGLTTVNIPLCITEIEEYTFANCKDLQSVTFPSSIVQLKEKVFAHCLKLESVIIPLSMTEIHTDAFKCCNNLDDETHESIATFSISGRNGVLRRPENFQEKPVEKFLSSSTKIHKDMFAHCSQLTSVEIPSSIEEIEEGAFRNCTNLSSVQFLSFTTKVHVDAFEGCSNLDKKTEEELKFIYSNNTQSAVLKGKQWDVFISYCSKDDDSDEAYNAVFDFMKGQGFEVFNSSSDLADYEKINGKSMQDAVRRSKMVFAALSDGFFESKWCKLEIEAAKQRGLKVIPVYSGNHHGANQVNKWIARFKDDYVFKENARDVKNRMNVNSVNIALSKIATSINS